MKIGIVYSGEQIQPWIFQFLYPLQLRVSCVADSSVAPENRARVEAFASFFECDFFTAPEEMFNTTAPKLDGVIIVSEEIASVPRLQLIESALAAGIHVLSPSPLNSLEDGIHVAAVSEKYKRLVMTGTRFIFGRCVQEILRIISEPTFGEIQDMRFLLGTGRVPYLNDLLKFGDSHFQIAFAIVRRLFAEHEILPEEIIAMAAGNGAPNVTCAVRFPHGALCTFCQTSNRQWGNDAYHKIEITGEASYIWSDLQTWKRFSIENTFRMGGGDEEISANVQGASGQLQEFCSAIQGNREPYAGKLRSLLPTLWLREMFQACIEKGQPSLKIREMYADLDEKIQRLESKREGNPPDKNPLRQLTLDAIGRYTYGPS
ncbi:MAG: Gfo/Idh/MocA family oxidoreductase, partial [Candidatus Poribacteria bacterium]|nr:Gfo/Idh/MocA family oxidoreductase [Candidatus Poribacteria bacterium]